MATTQPPYLWIVVSHQCAVVTVCGSGSSTSLSCFVCSLSALCSLPDSARLLLGVANRLYSDTENAHYSERVHVFGKLSGNKKSLTGSRLALRLWLLLRLLRDTALGAKGSC